MSTGGPLIRPTRAVFCNSCRHQADADLQAIVDAGRADMPLTDALRADVARSRQQLSLGVSREDYERRIYDVCMAKGCAYSSNVPYCLSQ
jgi:hypothetical protein